MLLVQGKKKAKLTGTPDVVRFKGTREYCLLQAGLKFCNLGLKRESLRCVGMGGVEGFVP